MIYCGKDSARALWQSLWWMGARSHGEISYQISTLWFFRHKEHSCHDNGNNRREPVYAEERKLGELYGLVARTAIGCYDSCYPDLAQLDFGSLSRMRWAFSEADINMNYWLGGIISCNWKDQQVMFPIHRNKKSKQNFRRKIKVHKQNTYPLKWSKKSFS